jgi:hypothetical protein
LSTAADKVPDKYSRTGAQIHLEEVASDCPVSAPSRRKERKLEGVESLQMMRKGQVKRLDERDAVGQAKLVESLFKITAWFESFRTFLRSEIIVATGPSPPTARRFMPRMGFQTMCR